VRVLFKIAVADRDHGAVMPDFRGSS